MDSARAADSTRRVAAEAKTDLLLGVVDSLSAQVAQADTVWRTTTKTVTNTVNTIVHDTATTDSTKVVLLVGEIGKLQRAGDSLSARVGDLLPQVAAFKDTLKAERGAWLTERTTLTDQVDLLKRKVRAWGFGFALGYGVTKAPDRVIAGPTFAAGLTYHF